MSLSGGKEAELFEAFNSMSRYLDDLFNIDHIYFEGKCTHQNFSKY